MRKAITEVDQPQCEHWTPGEKAVTKLNLQKVNSNLVKPQHEYHTLNEKAVSKVDQPQYEHQTLGEKVVTKMDLAKRKDRHQYEYPMPNKKAVSEVDRPQYEHHTSVRQRQPPTTTTTSYAQHQSLTSLNKPFEVSGYSVPPPPPASHTDEELGIPQQRFQNYREMREAIMIEIEKEKRRMPPLSDCRLIGDPIVPPRDDGMSLEEKLARNCEEKRPVEKAAAAVRRWQYDG
ncbi:hypothetical protein HAX54_037973 [Datura stramonium]|uniref:Uncharacterized protein n=1 Tax=Datura stramonium TaxID=4076 RepID=A0ABS8VKS7_DATST|nr:hypothetical protein [Datura stramonium]